MKDRVKHFRQADSIGKPKTLAAKDKMTLFTIPKMKIFISCDIGYNA